MIVHKGTCPVCEKDTEFRSQDGWFRDNLRCAACDSIPRERAFAWALATFCPDWRERRVHESSPADRAVSRKLRDGAKDYIASQFFPDIKPGATKNGVRCENLEAMTFPEGSIGLHAHLDVMEHVNRPDLCLREMERTLAPGGMAIFTTPVYKERVETRRRAVYFPDGVEHIENPPEYHGNPIDDAGSLVTFHFGQNFSDLMRAWAPGLSILQILPNDPAIGVIGEFRDVFVLHKRQG